MSRKSPELIYSKRDIEELRLVSADASKGRLALRAAMVLACLEGRRAKEVARQFHERPNTVLLWRGRFAESGVAGLGNRPRGATGMKYGAALTGFLVGLLKSRPPGDHPRWSGALLAQAAGVPLDAVWRHLRKAGVRLRGQRADGAGNRLKAIEIPLMITWKEDRKMAKDNERLDIEIVARIKGADGTFVEKTVRLDKVLPCLEDFDLNTKEGFLRDFDVLEKAVIQARDEMAEGLAEGYVAGAAKKKTEGENPGPVKSKRK